MQPILWFTLGLAVLVAATFWARRRRRARRSVLAGALAIGIVAAILSRRDPVPELDAARLAAAQARWEGRGPRDYDLSVDVHADRLGDARYDIAVRGGSVVGATRDGAPATGAEDSWSVAALFTMFERELELARQPQAGFGAPAGYRAYLFAAFDRDNGRPLRYRRVVGGASNGVEIRVVHFQAAP